MDTKGDGLPIMVGATSSDQQVGNRECSCKMFALYFISVLIGIAGVIVLLASPKECPSDYEEQDCLSCSNGCQTYDCTSDDGDTCSNKHISAGAIIGGVLLMVTCVILLITACCFQCRCCCKNAKF